MALILSRACSVPYCPEVNCRKHRSDPRAPRFHVDERRGTAHERGYGVRWRKARDTYLAAHPLCAYADRHGRTEVGTVVDHVRPHGGDNALFWDVENWQTLTKMAHDTKGMRERGLIPCVEHGQGTAMVRGRRICRDCGRTA